MLCFYRCLPKCLVMRPWSPTSQKSNRSSRRASVFGAPTLSPSTSTGTLGGPVGKSGNKSSSGILTELRTPQGEPASVLYHGGEGAAGIQGFGGGDEASLLNLSGLCRQPVQPAHRPAIQRLQEGVCGPLQQHYDKPLLRRQWHIYFAGHPCTRHPAEEHREGYQGEAAVFPGEGLQWCAGRSDGKRQREWVRAYHAGTEGNGIQKYAAYLIHDWVTHRAHALFTQ